MSDGGWVMTERREMTWEQALMWLNDRKGRPVEFNVEIDGESVVIGGARGVLEHWRDSMPGAALLGRDDRREEIAGLYTVGVGGTLDFREGGPATFERQQWHDGQAGPPQEELVATVNGTRIRVYE